MLQIETIANVSFGDTVITSIKVAPLTYADFVAIWLSTVADNRSRKGSATALLQRKRLVHQVHFLAAEGRRVTPSDTDITQLPLGLAKQLVASLEIGEGSEGAIIVDGDGISSPILYKLGNPISAKMNGKDVSITELEFSASVYGDIEDVLATDGDIPQTLELIRKVGKPIGLGSITSLPAWAIDRLSVADGVTIMRQVLPRFLG